MAIYDINQLRGRSAGVIQTESCRRSAVCVPLIYSSDFSGAGRADESCADCAESNSSADQSPLLLFEVRSSRIKTQPGDICFPGGRMEKGETAEETAVRETCEELLIKKDQISPVANLDVFCDGCLMVSPLLARLEGYRGTFSQQEVAEIFTVPLSWFMENQPECYSIELVHLKSDNFPYELINGGENYHFRRRFDNELFYLCNDTNGTPRIIWGITARIIKSFIDLLNH